MHAGKQLEMQSAVAKQRLAVLQQYLHEDPTNTSLQLEVATAAIECGEHELAASVLDRMGSSDSVAMHARGLLALAQHRFDDAVSIFSKLIGIGVGGPAVRFNRAYALFRNGDVEPAAREFEGLMTSDDAPSETLAYLMRCRRHLGDPQGAVSAWESASPHRKTVQAYGVASLAYLDCGRNAEALAVSEQALRSETPPVEALVVRATLAIGEGHPDRANELLAAAMERAPEDGRVWSAFGAAHMLQGNIASALRDFRLAAQYLPGHVGTWVSLAWCQILHRELADAKSSLHRALDIDRNFSEVHGGLAVVAALEGQREQALAAAERARRLDSNSLAARYAEAVLEGTATDAQAIQALARRLLRGRPGPDGVAMLDRALSALTKGR